MAEAKSLRDEIHRDRSSDEFTKTVSDGQPSPQPRESDTVVLGPTDAGSKYFAAVEKKGWEQAVEAWKSGRKDASWGFDLRFKADIDDATAEVAGGSLVAHGVADPPQYGTIVQPFYYPGIIEPPTRTPMVANLFAQGSTSTNLVRLVKEHVTVNGAAVTGEGQPYPLSEIQVRPHDFPVRDITTLLPVTEDILMDIPAMASYLSMRLGKFIQLAEETELLSGDGTGSHLEGILEAADVTTHTQTTEDFGGAVMGLLTAVYEASFTDPTWVAMSPTTWGTYVTERVDDGAGAYLLNAPSAAAVRSIWGLPITVSPVIPDDKVIVGNPSAGMIFRNGGLRVESSTGYGTFFGEGLVAIRAKVRTAFALFRPQAIGVLTLGS
jgi:HK97 family phage major capsid protein